MTMGPVEIERKVRQLDNDVQSIYTMLSAIQGTQERHTNRLGELAIKLDTLETKVNTLDGKVDTLDGKVDTLETKVNTLGGKVDTLGRHPGRQGRHPGRQGRHRAGAVEARHPGVDRFVRPAPT